jgi:hypothetical protein
VRLEVAPLVAEWDQSVTLAEGAARTEAGVGVPIWVLAGP